MTEEDARYWVRDRFGVPRETLVARFVDAVLAEAPNQNLVSASTITAIWDRHIVDSAQLVALGHQELGRWIDIGSGAGFPGLVIGILTDRHVDLIEPRRKRATFLEATVAALGLSDRVNVVCARAEQYRSTAAVISARAVAALPELLTAGAHLSTAKTLWILPKGPRAKEEVAAAQQTWHGMFHVEQSITDPQSLIITAKGVARR
ncbi:MULTISPECIES: 16S rRNA (guanine(527)-N(7))-methyltransferase RsmG [unclassified Sphingomonas]|uniref:16S rRNA (guanine(527)-N(7))-methyltransferase RsmG n=1 Tax=unclassified Sphingomonas TaxID=196159 RepID=UPI000BD641CF|nr:MAG: 16S rRNA (guanine(527)-N(7))-methyltransferase RsmG [Sphingomonas sp. 12-62-6]OYX38757.1 MAG: 16S rRNA (guanine(527)-N(7))-methyltransferase RsmG [Sphingomonas sp. 32-62-10]OYY64676.1 MAG: 16S rRNA (guanine(527)-N(7))-methyltransferase RsmG [Sphingomonas sp. 28-62-11]